MLLIGAALASGAVGMVGVYLDTAWHRTIGRDSFFILPHWFIYLGGLGIGVASVAAIARASLGVPEAFGPPVLRAGRLRVPLGFLLALLGVLTIVAAGPVDVWWHRAYGKDVLIWSPPHLQLHLGAAVTAVGLLAAIAAEAGRGPFRRHWLWRAAMLAVFVDLVHRGHFVLAHYTMVPETRTADFYPFLAALLFPAVLVAAARGLGPWAPTGAGLGFLAVALGHDLLLRAIDFDRYTLTPLVAVPALAVTLLARAAGPRRARSWTGVVAGVVFALVFTAMEAAWMAHGVGRPWPWARVVAGLPRSVVAGGLSGFVGWVLGGGLHALATGHPAATVFGSRGRARAATVSALGLVGVGLASTYQPQRFGPPMSVDELRLAPIAAFRYQEAIFWEALHLDAWSPGGPVVARSEGIIEGFPLPVGPGWCAPTAHALAADLPRLRFGLEVNGTPVDLAAYPRVPLRDRDGAHCAWIGVASRFQRASENGFRYTLAIEPPGPGRPPHAVVEMTVVFKDP